MKRGKLLLISVLAIVLAIAVPGGIYGYRAYKAAQSPFSSQVRKKISFTIFYPDSNLIEYKIDKATIKYDELSKLLSYIMVSTTTNKRLIVSEQVSPDMFSDIPEAYPKFLEQLMTFTTFDSKIGKVGISEAKQLKGEQSAIVNAQGTLMFIRAPKMSTDEWRKLIAGMVAL